MEDEEEVAFQRKGYVLYATQEKEAVQPGSCVIS